ncbi:hypothetical protein RND71_043975 [Anisodus tanguticus]|uniref:AAA+ ATPase domain-containing protein n=1 Tax=Anisodus tanguticus TaxID=243964 RepID=A0AAE1QNI3_9SOLA|nr:hypothetical protein RND71_043975 [Anisodus tanguticus]
MAKKLKKLSPGKTNSTTSSSNESDDIILNNDEVKTNSIFETVNNSKSLKSSLNFKSSESKSLKNFKSLFNDENNQSPEIKNLNNVLKLKRNLLRERLNKFNSKSSSTSKSTSKNSLNLNLSKGSSLGELIDILLNYNIGPSTKDITRDRFNIPRNQDEFSWNHLSKGCLLYGPPGTGKTLLARAVASQLEANFLKVVSSAIVDKYIGESARLIREMFNFAKDHQPCIIFMDEIDAIGGRRFSEGSSAPVVKYKEL